MKATNVYLIPGQGGYTPGIFEGNESASVVEVLEAIDKVAAEFGREGISSLLTEAHAPTADQLMRTDSFRLQLAVFATGVAGYKLAGLRSEPTVLVGHSMGEIAALSVAGAFSIEDGARLVCHRAEALLAHCPDEGGMMALGLPAVRTAHLIALMGEPRLALAVVNAPRQTVVSGPLPSLTLVARVAEALGVHTTALTAPFPFHGPMLAIAAQGFASSIGHLQQRPLRQAVYSPTLQRLASDDIDLKNLLVKQLTTSVDFMAAIRELHADGSEVFVECGQAGLAKLVQRCVPNVIVDTAMAAGERAMKPATAEVAKLVDTPSPPPAVAHPVASVDEVLKDLRTLYSSTLGYPIEVVSPDVDLEADLGIDSLKHTEMLTKVIDTFKLEPTLVNGRLSEQATLAGIAEVVVAVLTERSVR
ncbi:acyltransferase domain-containing protein [Micromonospora chersina]|uniref:acyl carrier protein n=1 Tax=Micromonospora chersina TaxID=47854 RepID=UPI00372256A5